MSDEPGKQQRAGTESGAKAAASAAGSARASAAAAGSTKGSAAGSAAKTAAAPAKGAKAAAAVPAKDAKAAAAAPAKGAKAAAPAKGAKGGAVVSAAAAKGAAAVPAKDAKTAGTAKGSGGSGNKDAGAGAGTSGGDTEGTSVPFPQQSSAEVEQKMKSVISDFISKCGVPRDNVSFGQFATMYANVLCRLTWRFKARHVDNSITRVSGGTEFMDKDGLSEFTAKKSRELEHDDEACRDFVSQLRGRSIKELIFLTKKINVLKVHRAIGVGNCTVCHGSGNSVCNICGGSGSVLCPSCGGSGQNCSLCRGTGMIMCESCKGRGKQICNACNGAGTQVVERYIRLEAQGAFNLDFFTTMPLSDKREYINLDAHEQDLVLDNTKLTQSNEERTPNTYQLQFRGQNRCCRLFFDLKGCPEKLCYTVCGDAMVPIAKPYILDYVFQPELTMITRLLSSHATRNDVDGKIALCKAISGKAILAKTFSNLDNACMHILRGAAHKHGISLESLTNDELIEHDPKIHSVYARARPDMIKRIAAVLTGYAQGFVSEAFAQQMAGKLLNFMPVLEKMNPKSKRIWSMTDLSLWLVVAIIMAILPYKSTALFCVMMAGAVAALTSFYATKNLTYFGAVQSLKVVRHGKIIPDLMPEAVESMKLMGITILIVFFMLFFWA